MFIDDMILYVEKPEITHTHIHTELLEPTKKYSKVARYKMNIQKSVYLLYTSNKESEKEIKKPILFTRTSKRIKYLVITFTQGAKRLVQQKWKNIAKGNLKRYVYIERPCIFIDQKT